MIVIIRERNDRCMKISKDDVKYVANLARLNVSEAEADKLASEMASIIEFADMLSEVDTSDIAPTNHAGQLENVFREDVVTGSYDRELILKNAPDTEAGCYRVPRVVE